MSLRRVKLKIIKPHNNNTEMLLQNTETRLLINCMPFLIEKELFVKNVGIVTRD